MAKKVTEASFCLVYLLKSVITRPRSMKIFLRICINLKTRKDENKTRSTKQNRTFFGSRYIQSYKEELQQNCLLPQVHYSYHGEKQKSWHDGCFQSMHQERKTNKNWNPDRRVVSICYTHWNRYIDCKRPVVA